MLAKKVKEREREFKAIESKVGSLTFDEKQVENLEEVCWERKSLDPSRVAQVFTQSESERAQTLRDINKEK